MRRTEVRSLRAAAKQSRPSRVPGLLRRAAPRNDKIIVSHSEQETERIAARFACTLHGGEILLLDGDLGAGKTVFVRGLAKGLGIRGRITSPTFVVMRAHETRIKNKESRIKNFIHVDAYRVRDMRDLEAIGLSEWLGRPDAVVAIEWGERVASALRRFRCIRIALQSSASGAHRIVIRRP